MPSWQGQQFTGLKEARRRALGSRLIMCEGDGAASVIRTRDLTLTKGALYRWSYGSITMGIISGAGGRRACLPDWPWY